MTPDRMTMAPNDIGLDACFSARSSGLRQALEAVGSFCAGRKLAPDLVSRAKIIVEELFTNTIKYGYCGECDLPVRLNLVADPVLTLVYEDDAPPFDPLRWKSGRMGIAPDEAPEGEAGIPMILGLAAGVVYVRLSNTNRLTITLL
jgi:anti-sigma regulatory factor (Ser/Thr protein kinase)